MTPIEIADQSTAESFEREALPHLDTCFRVACRLTGDPSRAEDLVQEVFLRAYRGLAGFRGEARLSTWVYRIAVNVCLNWVSSHKRQVEELPADLVDPGPSPVERLGRKQATAAVRAAVVKLPERQRLTLVLRVYQELTHKEIADIMDCSVGTVKANFFFAWKNRRKYLEAESSKLFERTSS